MNEKEFKLGDKVRHKSGTGFDMVIVEFRVTWPDHPENINALKGNPDFPQCSYYNPDTHKWEQQNFHAHELEALD